MASLYNIYNKVKRSKRMKSPKNRFLVGFIVVVFFLALVRLIFPSVAESRVAALPAKGSVRHLEGRRLFHLFR